MWLTNCSLSLPSDLLLFQKDKKVPTILPPDVLEPMSWICDRTARKELNLYSKFVFASNTGKSQFHDGQFHAIKLKKYLKTRLLWKIFFPNNFNPYVTSFLNIYTCFFFNWFRLLGSTVLRGYHAMKKSVNDCDTRLKNESDEGGLNKPGLLVATRLRKYMACVTQVRI